VELSEWHVWWKHRGARELRRLLLNSWDPIGVRDAPEAWDEYDGYMSPIVSLLEQDKSVRKLAKYLRHVRVDLMGVGPDKKTDLQAASEIHAWYQTAMKQAATPSSN
jgi:hypothetical protein